MKSKAKAFLLVPLGLVACCAYGATFQPNVTVISDDITYAVNGDGTYTVDETARWRVNTDQGVQSRSQLPLGYSATLQKLDVVEAYTTTKDGKRIVVAPTDIREQQSPASTGAPMFDDVRVKSVVFPAVEVGATMTAHWRRTQIKPLFPGQFSMMEGLSDEDEVQTSRVTVRAPASMKLFVDTVSMSGGRKEGSAGGSQEWQWEVKNLPAHPPEVGSVGAMDRGPRVAVTTFPDYAAVGAAYLQRAKPKSVVTPGVQKMADEITHGVSDKRSQADAIYRWVSANIRYVAIYLDFGGVVPHDAQTIMDAKYGDCKDHVTLLEALLAAKGIKSSPVLVNATDTYWTPKVAAAPGVFNHAISYLPEFNLYVDSTAGTALFGVLPFSEQGKSAVVANDGTGKSRLVTLPLSTAAQNRVDVRTQLIVDDQGLVRGKSEIKNAGTLDWLPRMLFASFPPGAEAQIGGRILSLTGQTGSGSYQHSDPHNLTTAFSYESEFELPGYVQLPGPGAFNVPTGLNSFSGVAVAFDQFATEQRDFAMPFVARHLTEVVTIRLPAGMKPTSLPKAAKVTSPIGVYESSYTKDGQTVTVKRSLDMEPQGPVIAPDQYPSIREMGLNVKRDLRSQILYQ